jgi:MFS family permease
MRLSLRQTFTALNYPNYRLWFSGQIVSLFGTWMQNTAQQFLIYELTHSPVYLGYVGFAAGIPSWLLMLFGGLAADRLARRTLLIITQTSMMLLAFILAGLTFLDIVQPWHIVVLAGLLGVANAFDAPARMAIIPELVDNSEDLTNAIALNGTMFNTATIIGPSAAGLIYAAFGPSWCFILNGITFLAVIVALVLMKLPKLPPALGRPSALKELKEGIQYVFSMPTVLSILGLASIVSLCGYSFVTLMPIWAVEVLGGDVTTNGLLRSAQGVGALIGALSIASLGRFRYRGKLLSIGTFTFPLVLIAFAFVRWLPLALLLLGCAGASIVFINNLSNSLVQSNVRDALRGRVMGIYSLTFFGVMPVGSLITGEVADRIGPTLTVVLGSTIILVFAIAIWLFIPRLRALE